MKLAWVCLLAGVGVAVAGPPRVFFNDRDVSAEVIEVNGRLYLPVEVLGAAVYTTGQTLHITLAARATPAVIAESARAAVYGRLTWNAGMFKGHRPDAGARVWLVHNPASLAREAGGTPLEPIPTRASGWPSRLDARYPHTVTDAQGRFAFATVVPGDYLLIFLSRHANGLAARDRDGKMRFRPIRVVADQPLDASYDFGVTAY
jgi:hypothetical protein